MSNSTDNVIEKIMAVEGALEEAEARILFQEAQTIRDGCIVEIGAHRGRSTAALALGSRGAHNAPVYTIEPHESFDGILGGKFGPSDRVHFIRNMMELDLFETIRLVNLSSEVVTPGWQQPVGLLWIDGDHRLAAVRRDVECWMPHLRPDATVILHDCHQPRLGPVHVAEQLLASGEWDGGEIIATTMVLRRKRIRHRAIRGLVKRLVG